MTKDHTQGFQTEGESPRPLKWEGDSTEKIRWLLIQAMSEFHVETVNREHGADLSDVTEKWLKELAKHVEAMLEEHGKMKYDDGFVKALNRKTVEVMVLQGKIEELNDFTFYGDNRKNLKGVTERIESLTQQIKERSG